MSNEEILTLKSKLSPAKQALLEKRLRGEIKSSSRGQLPPEKFPTITPNPDQRYQPFPLTDVQQAYWIGRSGAFELSNISTHVYFEVEAVSLDLERFEQAWQKLIDRHDMLRAIVRPDGQQQILEQVPAYKIQVLDLRDKDPEITASQLSQLRERLSHQVLPTDQWPLFEIQAAQLDEKKIRLCLSLDILIGDAWSFDIVLGELVEFIQNPTVSLPSLELSFRDYVLAEVGLQSSTLYQRSKDYWLNRVSTLPPAPDLPLAKSLAAITHPRFVHRTQRLDPAAWVCLKQRIREYSLTPSGLLLAAFAEVLSVWSKRPRFTLNLTLFNRLPLHPQVNQIMGDFTSLTLLAVDHSEQDSFAARSQRIQKQLWDDFDHRYFSGVQVLRELARLQKNPSGVLMPVVFTSTLINDGLSRGTPTEKLSSIHRLGNVTHNISQTPQVYLDLQVNEMGGTLLVELDAVEELFPAGLLDDMFAAYCRFLERLADQDELWHTPTRSLLPSAQLEQLVAFNATDTLIPETTLLHSLFFEQAQQHPQQIAVITSQQCLTYQELSDRALSLAHHLRQLGACPNQLVAIVMDKGWEQLVAVLAILASGAAYVPIDPDLPIERRSHLLQQTQVQCVLTQSHLDSSLDWIDTVTRLCVDTLELASPDSPSEWVQRSHDLAYVIYTSGSTGKPKGVMIDHRGAVNTILDINQRFQVSAKDRVLALSSLSFDLSVYDIFGALAAGGTIVIPDASCTKDPAHWLQMIEQHQVTLWNSVPALMQMLVESVSSRHHRLPKSLRLVLLSGDWLPLNLPEQIWSLSEHMQVISLGGATEASIWSILYPIEQVEPGWKSIPYGHPMANQRFYVLNDALQPCPLWVPGHLYIGGVGLAKGYWHDEKKTHASFSIHPQTQERLYKTGDLGRVLPNGQIEFLGRDDFQVKVNGYRIELGEIEATLRQHLAVKEAIVAAVGKSQENQQLVAYVVPNQDSTSAFGEVASVARPDLESLWDRLEQTVEREVQGLLSENLQSFAACMSALDRLSVFSMGRTLKELGLFIHPQERHSLAEIVHNCQIQPQYSKLLGQWFNFLESEGLLQRVDEETFVNPQPLPMDDPDELWPEVRNYAVQDGQVQVLLDYFQRSLENQTAMLKGEVNPLELFFPGGSWQTAESLYQLNPLSRYYNTLVQQVLQAITTEWQSSRKIRILEVGAGTGGTTAFLLPILPSSQTIYTYTDLSQFFITQAQEKFQNYPFVKYGHLDINQDPVNQGYESHSFDIIVAANVLHDARNIDSTLQYLRSLLTPSGLFIILETTRNTAFQLATVRFIEGFSHYEDARLQTNRPLLSVAEWHQAFSSSEFTKFFVIPKPDSSSETHPEHVMVTQGPAQVKRFTSDKLRNYLHQKLPDYMIPAIYVFLDALPLTSNGKVDRRTLPVPDGLYVKKSTSYVVPQTDAERMIAAVWQEVLQVEKVGIYDNFFEMGGDSLLLIRTQVKLQEILDQDLPIVDLIQYPTVESFAQYLSQKQTAQTPTQQGHKRAEYRRALQSTRRSSRNSS